MIKRLVILLFLFAGSGMLMAQQDLRFTQYMFNLYQVNSAYAGSRDAINMAAIVRSQWTGIDGAPSLQSLTVNAPVFTKNIGLGLKIINQSSGAISQTTTMATFAYHIKLGTGRLAFGISAGFLNNRFNWGKATFKDQIDQVQTSGTVNSFAPTFDFAGYYYAPTWYAGFQFANLNQPEYKTIQDGINKNYLNYNFIAGKAFVFSKKIVFKPSVLLQGTKGAFIGEINLSLLFNESFWVGITYRTNCELSLILEYNFNQKFRIGYSYDYSFKSIQTKIAGSNEIFLGYDIRVKNKKMVSSRYF
jgi:type IX secretion system PorP/SprF family membrane protein